MNKIISSSLWVTLALGICLARPAQAQFLDGVQEIIVSAPVSQKEDVNICYGTVSRRTQCDYQQAPLDQMTVPFWGQIVYTHRIAANQESRATFFITNENENCILRLQNETFMRNTRIMGNGNILSWDVSQALLGDADGCFENDDQLFIVLDLTVSVENDYGSTTKVRVTISNKPTEKPSANSYQIQNTVVKLSQ